MSSNLLKAAGLHTHNNKLGSVPAGAMLQADNIIIDRDGVIEPRRGFFQYAEFGNSESRSKQLLIYKGRIINHYSNVLQFENSSGTFTSFAGSYTEPETGRRIQGFESNGNLFFTTNAGIKKISAKSASDLSSTLPIISAGGVKAVNLKATPDYSSSGFLLPMSKVAYRLVWGIKDLNNNLILGTPSERVIVINESTTQSGVAKLFFLIPTEANSTDYFYQVYRTNVAETTVPTPTLDDLAIIDPGDEQKLVFEASLTVEDIAQGFIEIQEVTPESFAGANLYTNPVSGEGILQANDKPPLAKALGLYKNHLFYANTKTRHLLDLSLLGVGSFGSGVSDLIISNGINTSTFKFVGAAELVTLTCDTKANTTDGGYFDIGAGENERFYRVWLNVSGTTLPPAMGSRIGIEVDLSSGTIITADDVAEAIGTAIGDATSDFTVSVATNIVTIQAYNGTISPNASLGATPPGGVYAINTAAQGFGVAVQSVVSMTAANPTVLTTESDHGLSTGDRIKIFDSIITSPASIDGEATVTVLSSTTFSIPVSVVTVGAGTASFYPLRMALLSNYISPAQAVDTTARSLCDAINKISTCPVYAFYSSGPDDIPGLMYLESKTLDNAEFFVATTDTSIQTSFDPAVPLVNDIVSITANSVSPTITTATNHGLVEGDTIVLYSSTSTNSIDNTHIVSEYVSPTQFKITLSSAATIAAAKTFVDADVKLIPNTITIANHGFTTGLEVNLTNSGGALPTFSPALSNPEYVVRIDENTIQLANTQADAYDNIVKDITAAAGGGTHTITPTSINARFFKTSVKSSNEENINRIYYSKYQQPEAVPTTNYIDIGPKDQAIKAIVPLRDSLFIFKTDGTYRLSGESSLNFSVNLYDSSTIINAPDSVAVLDNQVYVSTTQGLMTVSDTGGNVITSPIEEDIIRLGSKNYTNFSTASFGVAYPSAHSYLFWTVEKPTDTVATQAYRYSANTNSWVKMPKSATCAILNYADDKLYIGPTDINYIEKERKDYLRTDYADRQYDLEILSNSILDNSVVINSAVQAETGDVLEQTQYLTIAQFGRVLNMLDTEINTDGNYRSLIATEPGVNLRAVLEQLATKLDTDAGITQTDYLSSITAATSSIVSISLPSGGLVTVTTTAAHNLITNRIIILNGTTTTPAIDGEYAITVTGANTFTIQASITSAQLVAGGSVVPQEQDFKDTQACFNLVVGKLNLDPALAFQTYPLSSGTVSYEIALSSVDRFRNTVYSDYMVPLIEGPVTLFKHIKSTVTYTPYHFGDPALLKQTHEGTFIFDSMAFTRATAGYSSDLSPNFEMIPFNGTGNGAWGNIIWGDEVWGGDSTQVPLRTLIPREKQRCRYLQCKFSHSVARESYSLLGISLEGRPIGPKGYK